jgi:ubiquinone/menaquinone biosynthesis C-methylase UbiE
MERKYQYDFSAGGDAMFDVTGRTRKAETMVRVLADFIGTPLGNLALLNVGGSAGIIDSVLAEHFGAVSNIDIDADAIRFARERFQRPNLEFRVGDALAIDFPDDHFDVVVCSQVYEHVVDAEQMMREIFRVLKPGGVCYFAASNRLMWNEPHYNLPLLSVVPRPLAHLYVRLSGRANQYHELHYSYWGLKKLVSRFVVHDYTKKMVDDPEHFAIAYMVPAAGVKGALVRVIATHFLWLMPGYVWLLQKPEA